MKLVSLVLGSVALLCSCNRTGEVTQAICGYGSLKIHRDPPPVQSVLDVPGAQMRDVVRDESPALPDQRFLIASATLEEWITEAPVDEIRVDLNDSAWLLRSGEKELGRLPTDPSFSDALALLQEQVGGRLPQGASTRPAETEIDEIESRLRTFRPLDTINALRRTDALWRAGSRDSRLLGLVARGLVLLDLQGSEETEIGDALGGRALAALALAKATGGTDLRAAEALLANRFGYSVHGAEMARSLPPDSPVRAYVLQQTEALRTLAEDPSAEPLARFLYLSRLAEQRNIEAWQAWIERYVTDHRMTTAVLSTGFLAGRHEVSWKLTPVLPYVALLEFWIATGTLPDLEAVREFNGRYERELLEAVQAIYVEVGGTQAGLIRRFETDAKRLEESSSGPFLDADVIRGYFGGHLYGSILQLALYDLDILASLNASTWNLKDLEGAPGPHGDQIVRWYASLVRSAGGRADIQELRDDLERVQCVGAPSLLRTFEELEEQLPYMDARVQSAAGALARRLDTRPAHQFVRGRLAATRLDLSSRDALYRNLVDLAAPTYSGTQSWLANASGDTTTLRAMVLDSDLPFRWRVDALKYLVGVDSVGDSYVRDVAGRLVAAEPDRWESREVYLKHLERVGAYKEGIDVVRSWKFGDQARDDFDRVTAQTALARLYYEQGAYRRAESAIENLIPPDHGGPAGTLGRAALILQRVRREEEALQIARSGVERYPDFAYSRAVLAEILWRQNRFSEVPAVVHDSLYPMDVWGWRGDLAETFLRVFADRPVEEAEDAFREIVRAGVPSWISEALPQGLSIRNRPDLAFALQAQLQATDAIGSYRNPIRAYLYLKEWRGEPMALTWIRPVVPSRILSQVSRVMYNEGADELLWELIPDPEETTYPEIVWLMRAAAETRGRDGEHLQELRAHYQTARANDFDVMGRYLLGLETEETLLGLATTTERKTQIAYYVGLKARSEGRFRDALDWYRVVLAIGDVEKYEYASAFDALRIWENSHWTVDRLALEDAYP